MPCNILAGMNGARRRQSPNLGRLGSAVGAGSKYLQVPQLSMAVYSLSSIMYSALAIDRGSFYDTLDQCGQDAPWRVTICTVLAHDSARNGVCDANTNRKPANHNENTACVYAHTLCNLRIFAWAALFPLQSLLLPELHRLLDLVRVQLLGGRCFLADSAALVAFELLEKLTHTVD